MSSSDGFVRLRPPEPKGESVPDDVQDIEAYFMRRREVLADELREVERILLKRGKITRLLCAPGRVR